MILNTEKRYADVSKRLIQRYRRETGLNWKTDINQFFDWMYLKSESWMPATWRQYKSAMIQYMSFYGSRDSEAVLKNMSKKPSSLKNLRKKNRTSRQKQKKLPQDDFILILSDLKSRESKYANILANWLYVSIITGVRPIEWHETEFIKNDRGCFLVVQNAKYSQNRANGHYRTLDLRKLNSNELQSIQDQVQLLSEIDPDEFQRLKKGCGDLLYRVSRKIWPNKKKYPTLYSARHQFSANAKKTDFTLKELAAIMGHASEDTATLHYGKKRDGQEEIKVRPIEEEVKTVRSSKKMGFFNKIQSSKKNSNSSVILK